MHARITLLPGDGIGPEVVAEGRRVLARVAELFGHRFEFQEALIGGCAIEVCGSPLPPETLEACEEAEAVLLGAVGGPRWSDPQAPVRPEQGLLALRSHFDLFANLRPVKVFPALLDRTPLKPAVLQGTDMLIVRELTGGLYFGDRQEAVGQTTVAVDTLSYSTEQVQRVVHVAMRAARGRRGRLTSVDKANVLASSRLWRRTVDELRSQYPEVQVEHALVDSCAMHLLTRPASFDVIVTENMFGDILSDEAAVLAGSLGLLPSASLGSSRFGVYEPIHGSAPDIAGRAIANPVGTILSCAMLLRHSLELWHEAEAVEGAVSQAIEEGACSADLGGDLSTSEFAGQILSNLKSAALATTGG